MTQVKDKTPPSPSAAKSVAKAAKAALRAAAKAAAKAVAKTRLARKKTAAAKAKRAVGQRQRDAESGPVVARPPKVVLAPSGGAKAVAPAAGVDLTFQAKPHYDADVIVVGAGWAGLTAARTLIDAGVSTKDESLAARGMMCGGPNRWQTVLIPPPRPVHGRPPSGPAPLGRNRPRAMRQPSRYSMSARPR